VPALIDTTVRLLSQEPLAGRVPTASILELADVLDGRAYLQRAVAANQKKREKKPLDLFETHRIFSP
jgi:hypothetical protein